MACTLCVDRNKKIFYNDCIIECLENIKIHYTAFKTELDEQKTISANLITQNTDLTIQLEKLKSEQKSATVDYGGTKKKRKTNSFDSSTDFEECPPNQDCNFPSLNDAIGSELELEDTFFVADTQKGKRPSIEKDVETEMPSFSLKDNSVDKQKITTIIHITPEKTKSSEEATLPKMSKEPNWKTTKNQENRNPCTSSSSKRWKCKDDLRTRTNADLTKFAIKDFNMSFVQPVIAKENNADKTETPLSPHNKNTSPPKSPPNMKNISLSLSGHKKLRQATLRFKRNALLNNESFNDIITASPTPFLGNKSGRSKSSRKTSKDKDAGLFNFNIPTQLDKNPLFLKSEQLTNVKEKIETMTKPISTSPRQNRSDETPDVSGIAPIINDSSLFIVPASPPDVICIENTESEYCDNINSADLLKELMKSTANETSDFLKRIESQKIKTLKNQQIQKNEKRDDNKIQQQNETGEKMSAFDCAECQNYIKFIGRDMSREELEIRLKNCTKHKKPLRLHETPEGFWNPLFPPTQIQETFIDTRLFNNKRNLFETKK